MFGFLFGLALSILCSCVPWFIAGIMNPQSAIPDNDPSRAKVVLRYLLTIPGTCIMVLIASLVGGLISVSSMMNWPITVILGVIAGLFFIPLELKLERSWWRWLTKRKQDRLNEAQLNASKRIHAEFKRRQKETGLKEMALDREPPDADDIIRGLWQAKKTLLKMDREDLAIQADRFYTRYTKVLDLLADKFDPRELAWQRSRNLVAEVSRDALARLDDAASLLSGISGIDPEFAQRRLTADSVPDEERRALRQRLQLIADNKRRVLELASYNEAALTALDDTAVAVSRISSNHAELATADEALHELRRFSETAAKYNRT